MSDQQSDWPDLHVARLKEVHATGASFSETAIALNREFGTAYSRAAISAKVHRLGIQRGRINPPTQEARKPRRHPRPSNLRPAAPDVPRVPHVTNYGTRLTVGTIPEAPDLPPEPPVPATAKGCTLMQLSYRTCRWPCGDPQSPDFFFCGAEPALGVPYCPGHARIAYAGFTRRENTMATITLRRRTRDRNKVA